MFTKCLSEIELRGLITKRLKIDNNYLPQIPLPQDRVVWFLIKSKSNNFHKLPIKKL